MLKILGVLSALALAGCCLLLMQPGEPERSWPQRRRATEAPRPTRAPVPEPIRPVGPPPFVEPIQRTDMERTTPDVVEPGSGGDRDAFIGRLCVFLGDPWTPQEVNGRLADAAALNGLMDMWEEIGAQLGSLRLARIDLAEPILDDLIDRGLAQRWDPAVESVELPGVLSFRRGRVAGASREEYLVRITHGSYPELDAAHERLLRADNEGRERIAGFLGSRERVR